VWQTTPNWRTTQETSGADGRLRIRTDDKGVVIRSKQTVTKLTDAATTPSA
jgi:hypothetical protein